MEPNQDYNESVDIGSLDCDSVAGGSFDAVLDGETSPDWFYFRGQWDDFACNFDPIVTVTLTSDPGREFCFEVTCVSEFASDTDVTCTAGTQDGDACCGTGTLSAVYNCAGVLNESGFVDIIVADDAADCVELSFEYAYTDGG